MNAFVSKLNSLLPGMILESRPFGRTDMISIWVEAKNLLKVARQMKEDPEIRMDSLENLSMVELDEVLVATYFLRSSATHQGCVIRVSTVPDTGQQRQGRLPSVREVWPMCEPMEKSTQELFGVQFTPVLEDSESEEIHFLPDFWEGYPLRKDYVFPKEVFGIHHSRSPAHSANKKRNS